MDIENGARWESDDALLPEHVYHEPPKAPGKSNKIFYALGLSLLGIAAAVGITGYNMLNRQDNPKILSPKPAPTPGFIINYDLQNSSEYEPRGCFELLSDAVKEVEKVSKLQEAKTIAIKWLESEKTGVYMNHLEDQWVRAPQATFCSIPRSQRTASFL